MQLDCEYVLNTSLMRSHALSRGRPANDVTGEAVEDAMVGEVDSALGGEGVPPPNTRLGTTASSPSPDTGNVTDVQEGIEGNIRKLMRKVVY